mgnify:CR=1 FL=1
MSKEKAGYYWHVHHDKLIEYSDDIDERLRYIKDNKPPEEINIRLELLKKVKGVLPKPCRDAVEACRDADKAYQDADKAYQDADKACRDAVKACRDAVKACRDADKACRDAVKPYRDADKAYRDADKACRDAVEACRDAVKPYRDEIEALHKKECPNCPWDGDTIFPKDRKGDL